jgi:osmotically inducible lipoprotein OsmB
MKKLYLAITIAITSLGLAACAENPSREDVGTAAGAVVGGAVGYGLTNGPVGTVGGAAAGALIGHELGEDSDREHRRY